MGKVEAPAFADLAGGKAEKLADEALAKAFADLAEKGADLYAKRKITVGIVLDPRGEVGNPRVEIKTRVVLAPGSTLVWEDKSDRQKGLFDRKGGEE
jgi:hypothetical protein